MEKPGNGDFGQYKYEQVQAEGKFLCTLLLLFAIHHVIFIGARIALFAFTTCCCLGCVCIDEDVAPFPAEGIPVNEYDPVGDRVVSF